MCSTCGREPLRSRFAASRSLVCHPRLADSEARIVHGLRRAARRHGERPGLRTGGSGRSSRHRPAAPDATPRREWLPEDMTTPGDPSHARPRARADAPHVAVDRRHGRGGAGIALVVAGQPPDRRRPRRRDARAVDQRSREPVPTDAASPTDGASTPPRRGAPPPATASPQGRARTRSSTSTATAAPTPRGSPAARTARSASRRRRAPRSPRPSSRRARSPRARSSSSSRRATGPRRSRSSTPAVRSCCSRPPTAP